MKIEVRSASASDSDAWVRLRRDLWPHCPEERHLLEISQLLAGRGIVAVAQVREELVGFAEVSIRADHVEGTAASPAPYLEGWYVQESFRGRGVGRALLAFVEQWALARDYRELASDAELENLRSIELHGALGFREVGRSVHFVKTLKAEEPNQALQPTAAAGRG